MYTPKRFQPGRPSSPYMQSPYQSLNLSKDIRDTPSKGYRDTPNKGYQVLEQDESYQLLTYGGNLPVKVAEVLAAPENVNMSAKIENSNWAYIINNRKLYAWRTSSGHNKKTVSCFEFQLATTVIPHKFSLTCILESSPADSSLALANKTSLISVSPEGVARYWQNITQPALMVEASLNIGDKQCSAIQSVMPYGCILVTTTNDLYHLFPSNSGINYHQVAVPSGMLSNIGKRMSSFWSQPVVVQSNYPPAICNGTLDFDALERHLFVSLDQKLQKWEFSGNSFGSSKMIFEVDLLSCINNYAGITEFSEDGCIDGVQTIDMKNTGYGTILLLALWKGGEYKIVLGILKVNAEDLSFNFERLIGVDYHEDDFPGNLQLMVPFPGYQAYISTTNVIISLPVSRSTRNPIKVAFNKVNSAIIGAGSCGNDAIFLSKRDGLVNLKVTYVAEPVLIEKSQVQFFNEAPNEEAPSPTDLYSVVRTLFISHSQGKVQNIVNLISSIDCTGVEFGAVIMKVASELLDSYPPSDPRWASGNTAFPPSVLLLNQLRDKEKIYDEYLNFLSIYDLLDKVGEPNDEVLIFLREGAEKLKCAVALLDIPAHLVSVVDDVINSTELDVVMDEESVNRKETFFAKISRISDFFLALKKVEDSKLLGMLAIKDQVELILSVSQIITSCFQTAWQYRRNVPNEFLLTNHVPWTGSTIGANNREIVKQQIDIMLNQALCNVDSTKIGSVLTQQVVLLADLLFDGYLRELAKLKNLNNGKEMEDLEVEYNRERNKIITALVHLGYFEESATLAEHYKDFYMLIFLCERTNDMEKLKQYKIQFKNEGFGDVLYKWYVEKGAWSQLMTVQDPSNDFDSLLSSHQQLSWVHFIGSGEYNKACDVLSYLAAEEKDISARKKSMLVLANLAILASDEPGEVIEAKMSDIDKHLELMSYQEQIMKDIGKNSTEDTSPLSAEDLIKICLNEDVPVLTESLYISLIELLRFLSTNQQQYSLDIWTKCILQDRWEEAMNLDIMAIISQKIFFKCLKYWRDKGTANGTLPYLKDLIPKLLNLPDNMLHQLKVCYEMLSLQELAVGS